MTEHHPAPGEPREPSDPATAEPGEPSAAAPEPGPPDPATAEPGPPDQAAAEPRPDPAASELGSPDPAASEPGRPAPAASPPGSPVPAAPAPGSGTGAEPIAETPAADFSAVEPAAAASSEAPGAPPVGDDGQVPSDATPRGSVPAEAAAAAESAAVGDGPTAEVPGHGAPGDGATVGASGGDAETERIPGASGARDVPRGGATAAGFPAGGVPPSSGPWNAFSGRRLARSSQRKVIAGVAGGLGEYTGIDPVLFRVLFAVLTLFGGSGILLYVVGWLFMPADDEQSSPVESLLHRGPGGSNRARDAVAAAALVIAGLVLAGVLALGDARDLALVLVVVGGAFFLVRNLQERRDDGPPQPAVPEPAPPPPAPYETPLPTYQPQPAFSPPPAYPPVQHTAPTATLTPPPAPHPPRPREHSALGMITVCLLLVVLGVAAALTAAGAIDPEADDLLAVAVGTIGAGLLVGTWFGRARWLTWLGIPLLVALIVVSTSNVSLKGGVGDRRYDPQTAAQIEREYRIGVGNIRLDLSEVDLSKQLVRTKVSAGVGNIEVIVPRTADVSVDGRAGIGEVDLFGQVANGTSAQRSVVDHGPGGDATIDLALDLDVSIGRVEVDRAAA